MLRRAAVITAGLAMATSFGLASATIASAAVPTLKIKPNATWTFEVTGAGCEQETFNTVTHHFISDLAGDKGTWSGGGGTTVSMSWTAGGDAGVNFFGRFVSTTKPVEYKGPISAGGATQGHAKLVKGAVKSFNGSSC